MERDGLVLKSEVKLGVSFGCVLIRSHGKVSLTDKPPAQPWKVYFNFPVYSFLYLGYCEVRVGEIWVRETFRRTPSQPVW